MRHKRSMAKRIDTTALEEVETLNVITTPARPAQLGSTELQFKCVPRGSTAKPLVRESDKIIEIRSR